MRKLETKRRKPAKARRPAGEVFHPSTYWRRAERARAMLEDEGFTVVRSRTRECPVHLVAIGTKSTTGSDRVRLIQFASENDRCRDALAGLDCPGLCTKELWRWSPRATSPEVQEIR